MKILIDLEEKKNLKLNYNEYIIYKLINNNKYNQISDIYNSLNISRQFFYLIKKTLLEKKLIKDITKEKLLCSLNKQKNKLQNKINKIENELNKELP